MKSRILLTISISGIIISAIAQKPTMILTFTADDNDQFVPLDSVLIENLTQGGDTTLYAPDTVLVLDYVTGIGESEAIEENTFSVSQNYPNPFNGKTEVNLFLPEKDNIKITVRDILGRELAHYENTLNRGNHNFAFYSGNEKYYLFTIIGKQTSQTIKMLNAGSHMSNGEKCKIDYTGSNVNASGFKSQRAINNFGFTLGDELMFTAYASTAIGNLGSAVVVDTPEINTIYEFDIIGGLRCPGMPTLSDIDGNVYNTVQIGNQCWMKENLKTTTYSNGTPIPNITDNQEWTTISTGAYAWQENDISWKNVYGAIYNWYTTVDPNGLCPDGWHVPSDDEWTVLTDFIGGTGSPHGNEMKSCRRVNSPLGGGCNTTEHPRWNEYYEYYGTDDYGFSGLPGGNRDCVSPGSFGNIGIIGKWWSSSQYGPYDLAGYRALHYDYLTISYEGHDNKHFGYSIRCLKD
jgi:uncharacterized protein (TIGR02145 family)